MSNCGVYYITNKITGEIYIGSSKDLKQRMRNHKSKKVNTKISLSIQQYGWDNHLVEVLKYCSAEELVQKEKMYIDFFKPQLNIVKYDFNQEQYDKVRKQSAEYKAKLSKSNKALYQRKKLEKINAT